MKLTQKLPFKHFLFSQILLLTVGLGILFYVNFIANIQYQKSSNPFMGGPITMPPKTLRLDLEQPSEDTLTFQSSIIVSGKTSPFVDVLTSTDSKDVVIKSEADGSFSTALNLIEGINSITVTTFDSSGDSRSVERTVYFSKEKI